MGTITGTQLISRVSKKLFDETGIAWAESELFADLRAGLRALVSLKPDAFTVNASVLLVAGIKQSLPEPAIVLIDIRRNMGSTGSIPGRAITSIPMQQLDNEFPDWPTETAANQVLHYMHDAKDPKVYYVTPPSPGNRYVEAVYSACPVMAAVTDVIPVNDVYESPLFDFVMACAYAKDSEHNDMQKSGGYMSMFRQTLGLKSQSQFAFAGDKPDGTVG